MNWIKKNVAFVASSAIALVLLGLAGFYLYEAYAKNGEVQERLTSTLSELDKIYKAEVFPNKENIQALVRQREEVDRVAKELETYFAPVSFGAVEGPQFRTLLDRTLSELRKRAAESDVKLPNDKYSFSFTALNGILAFDPKGFPALPEQLAEVKTIADALFDAQVNRIESIRRTKVSPDDRMADEDYHNYKTTTNAITGVIISSYIVRFQSFSPELQAVLSNLQKHTNSILVKLINVTHTSGPSAETDESSPVPPWMNRYGLPSGALQSQQGGAGDGLGQNYLQSRYGLPGPGGGKDGGGMSRYGFGGPQAPVAPVPRSPAPGSSKRPKVVINEKVFRVELLLEFLKKPPTPTPPPS